MRLLNEFSPHRLQFVGDQLPASMRRLSFLLSLLLSLAGLARAAIAQGLTEDDVVHRALEVSDAIEAARAEVRGSRARLREGQAARLPRVQALANYTRLTGSIPEVEFAFPGLDTTFTILPIELTRYHTEIALEQPLFTGFRVHHQIQSAAARLSAAEERARRVEAQVAFEARAAFWNVVRARALRDALGASLSDVTEHVRIVEIRVEERTALRRDLLSARTRLSELRLEQLEAEHAATLAQLDLNRLLDLPLERAPQLAPSQPPAPSASRIDSLGNATLREHPELRALEDEIAALERDRSAARGGWLPQVTATGRYVYARPNPYFFTEQDVFRGTGEVGISLQWQLYEGGARSARVQQAQAALDAARARLAEARQAVGLEIDRRRFDLERAEARIVVARDHEEAAREAYRVVQVQFVEEAALTADVLEAERNVRVAEARTVDAQAELGIAAAALLRALGKTW